MFAYPRSIQNFPGPLLHTTMARLFILASLLGNFLAHEVVYSHGELRLDLHVTPDGAVISWGPAEGSSLNIEEMDTCTLHYGPRDGRVRTEVRLSDPRYTVTGLVAGVNYFAYATCSKNKDKFSSNMELFKPEVPSSSDSNSTRTDSGSATLAKPVVSASSSSSYKPRSSTSSSNEGQVLVVMSKRHMNPPRRDPHNSSPSYNVILGAVCGVVGFVIINVTVVLGVRQCSQRRARRRRDFELQLEQHFGRLYCPEEFVNA
ncbi:uncharacterized protein LOC143027006 [Oratosquilla oratoria]|uniref:uncharacterized protein LOC143027006 n=1 Tax=Oratosquilla oratoria TaxID=337810 RepID=UPI003F775CD1